MTSSLIRTVNPDDDDYSTVFWMNIIFSTSIYAVIYFTAPYISLFFEQDLLTPIIRVYCISFVIQSLMAVQTTRLTKELRFRLQMGMQIPSVIVAGIFGVFLAYNDFGVWSLVVMNLLNSTLFMLQHWFRSGWKPKLNISRTKLKNHF